MKKRTITAVLFGLAMTGILLFSACSNVLTPSSSQAGGMGTVTVSFSAAGRAALVPGDTIFDFYTFTFLENDFPTDTSRVDNRDRSNPGTFTFSLKRGHTYTMNAEALTGDAWDTAVVAAQGVSGSFTVGDSTQVTVKLTGVINEEVTGQFTFNIQYPAGAVLDQLVLLSDAEHSINLTEDKYAVTSGTDTVVLSSKGDGVTVASGWYFVIVRLSMDGKTAGYANGVQILPGANTPFVREFSEADFKAEVDTDEGTPTINWHGFRVITEADKNITITGTHQEVQGLVTNLYDQYNADARATQYSSFTDPVGGTYQDVLKVEGPDGGFTDGMALIYDLPEEGDYIISMKMWLEPGKSGSIHWQYLGGDQNILQSVTYTSGEWVSLASRIHHTSENNTWWNGHDWIYLNGNNGNTGLRDAYVLIRDVQVIKDDVIQNESYLNEPVGAPDDPLNGGGGSTAGPLWISHDTVTLIPTGIRRVTANQSVTWTSSDPSVATAETEGASGDDYGQIIGVNPGTATVTVTGAGGTKQIAVIVEQAPNPSDTTEKYIALTFDDGPGGDTAAVLDAFRDNNATATFFLIGHNINPANYYLLKRMRDEGHDIGDHTMDHTYGLSYYDYMQSLASCQNMVRTATSDDPVTPQFLRAPSLFYYYPDFVNAAKDSGLPFIGGELTYDSGGRDAANGHDSTGGYTVQKLIDETLKDARPWGIIINHDNGESSGNMAEAMRTIIPELQRRGYKVVSLSQMLAARRSNGLIPGNVYDTFETQFVPSDPDYQETITNVTSVTVNPSSFTLLPGQTKQLTASVQPARATDRTVTWTSSNDAVATVVNGLVTALSLGEATITAVTNSTDGGGNHLTDRATVSVVSEIDEYWHGFLIPGRPENDSRASWVKNQSLQVPGDTAVYNDVLKLIPPAGGYQKLGTYGACPMYYELPEAGNYTLSLKMWVESADPADIIWVDLLNTSTGDEKIINRPNVTSGAWLDVSVPVTFPNSGTNALSLIGLAWDNNLGLRGATVYFRDMVLKKDGVVIDSSTPNAEVVEPPIDQVSWHGFKVITEADKTVVLDPNNSQDLRTLYPRYYSGAQAVPLSTFEDSAGNTYNDVLEVKPPSGGYQSGMALIYELINGYGEYNFSMKVWLDKPGTVYWQYLGNDGEVFPSVTSSGGQWVTLSSSITHKFYDGSDGKAPTFFPNADTEFIYLCGGGSSGLQDATIYIRDVVVTKDGTVIDSSTHNADGEGPVENDGVNVTEWNGFRVITEADQSVSIDPENPDPGKQTLYARYYSGAQATLYNTYTDQSGTYSDVLEVKPPANGYPNYSMALIYELPGYGDYTFSMKVWIEPYKSGVVQWKYLGDDSTICQTDYTGTWVTLTASFSHPEGAPVFSNADIDFLYLLALNNGQDGLGQATVYIRDVVVTKDGAALTSSIPNGP